MVRSNINKIIFENLSCGYGFEGSKELKPINGLSFTIEPDKIYLLKGGNGLGKSTLLKALLHEIPDSTGTVTISSDGFEEVRRLTINELENIIKPVFYMPQKVQTIFPERTYVDTVLHTWARIGTRYASRDQAKALFTDLGATERVEELRWRQCDALSGGQAQYIALILAFLSDTEFLLLDEPTAAVSKENKQGFVDLINKLKGNGEHRFILIASHDPVLDSLADEVIDLDKLPRR